MAVTIIKLSGSGADGGPIKVAAVATPGTTLHTGHATSLDLVWLYASNLDSSARTLTIEWGGTTDPDDLACKQVSLPANSGPTLIIAGLPITNSGVIAAFASLTNVITITGLVHRVA